MTTIVAIHLSAVVVFSQEQVKALPRYDRAVAIAAMRQKTGDFNTGFVVTTNEHHYLLSPKRPLLASSGTWQIGLAFGENNATRIPLSELAANEQELKWIHHPTEWFSVLELSCERHPDVLKHLQRLAIPLPAFEPGTPRRGSIVESVGIGMMLVPRPGVPIHLLTIRSYIASEELTPPRFWGPTVVFTTHPETPICFAGAPVFQQTEDPDSLHLLGMNLGGITDGGTTKIDAVIPAHVIKDFLVSLKGEE